MHRKHGLGLIPPTPRLLLLIVLSIAATLLYQPIAVFAFLGLSLFLLVLGGRYPKTLLVAVAMTAFVTFLGNALFARDEPTLSFLVFRISPLSVERGIVLAARITSMMLIAISYIAATTNYELLLGFRGFRLPRVANIYLTVMIRFIDILDRDFETSMMAMGIRGINWQGSLKERINGFRLLPIPTIYRLLNHITTTAIAVDGHGVLSQREESNAITAESLTVEDVSVFYGQYEAPPEDQWALRNVSTRIEPRQITYLAGASGAGKTTFLLTLSGLIPHTIGRMSGRVLVGDEVTRDTPMAQLSRKVRFLGNSAVANTIGVTVEDELNLSGGTPDMCRWAVEQVRLQGFEQRNILSLSGGEMQRAALASAMVAQTPTLLLDEPMVQLDPLGKIEMSQALEAVAERREQLTIVTTEPHVALRDRADHLILLEKGQIVYQQPVLQNGIPADLLKRAHLRTSQLQQLAEALGIELPQDLDEACRLLQAPPTPAAAPPSEDGRPRELLLQARNVSYTYPKGPKALNGVDLTIHQGEFIAMLGANGSGKSTIGLVMAQARAPFEGTITLNGEKLKPEHRGRIGYVFQDPELQMITTRVHEELAFGPKMLGWSEERIQQAVDREIARFNLPPEAHPLELSSAQARQLAIAAILTMEPDVLILDEATNGLDEAEVQHLADLLLELKQAGQAIILITHDVELACQLADRAVVMKDGRVILDGPIRRVMTHKEELAASFVVPPQVVEISLALWPDHLPALTPVELASWLRGEKLQLPAV